MVHKTKKQTEMVTYTNDDTGCTMSFEKGIPEEEILKRLSWMGKKWRKMEDWEMKKV